MRNDVSLWVAIALSVRVHSRQPLSPMPIPCTGAWLSRTPSSHLSYQPCRRRRLYSPRLCGSYLSRSAAPRRWNRQLPMCLPMCTRGSRAAPGNKRCFDSVWTAECLRFGALRLSSTLLSLRAIMGTEYEAFHVSSPGAAREREIMLFSACVRRAKMYLK